MPETLNRAVEWFKARSTAQKVLIVIAAVLVLGAVSRVDAYIAGLFFVVALVVLVVQLVRRRPVRVWAIIAGGSVVVALIFGGLASAIYGPTEDQAGVNQAQEPTAAEAPEPPAQEQEEAAAEPEAEPVPEAPPSPEEEARDLMQEHFGEQLREASVVEQANGGYGVFVEFDGADNFTTEMIKRGMEIDMREAYELLYTEANADVRTATMAAYFPMIDQMGDESEDVVYKTELDRQTAEQINWENAVVLEWDNIWDVQLFHPEFRE